MSNKVQFVRSGKDEVFRDPRGNPLRMVMLQVVEENERGPSLLRVRHDDETMNLAEDPYRKFFLVWAPLTSELGDVMSAGKLVENLHDAKSELATMDRWLSQTQTELHGIRLRVTELEQDNAQKTEAIRALQKERDPDRIEAMLHQRVAERTGALESQLAHEKSIAAELRREVNELRASKKKLREALERLKGAK